MRAALKQAALKRAALKRAALNRAALKRALYRVRQFLQALLASWRPLDEHEQGQVRAFLNPSAWLLFAAMPRADQRHGLNVLHALDQNELAAGDDREPLLQAALLHDCGKHAGRVQLWHRVAAVLLKAFWPRAFQRWGAGPAPAQDSWSYPFWAYVNHPSLGASLAVQAGCPPLTVWLIRHHQDAPEPVAHDLAPDGRRRAMLAALQAVDDNN